MSGDSPVLATESDTAAVKRTAYLQAGSGGLPLGLASTEGLAITGEAVQLWMARL